MFSLHYKSNMSGSDCNDTGSLDALASILTHLKCSVLTVIYIVPLMDNLLSTFKMVHLTLAHDTKTKYKKPTCTLSYRTNIIIFLRFFFISNI